MRRGEKPLTAILSEEYQTTGEKGKKGIHLDRRNDTMACRFYYYFTLVGLRYDKCLETLSLEFWLGENSIAAILERQQQYIKQLKEKNTGLKALQQKYPAWQWKLLKAV